MVVNASRILLVVCALGAIALAVLFVLKVVYRIF
jgi:hypothetical protein